MTSSSEPDADLLERVRATEGHTPGPWWAWQVGACGDCEFFICTGVAGDSGGSLFEGGGVMGSDAENNSNAALMALAPEMKAEIERLTAALNATERERDAAVARAERAEAALAQIAAGETYVIEGEAVSIPLIATLAQEIALDAQEAAPDA